MHGKPVPRNQNLLENRSMQSQLEWVKKRQTRSQIFWVIRSTHDRIEYMNLEVTNRVKIPINPVSLRTVISRYKHYCLPPNV